MRLYYIDESEGPRYYVRTALGVDAERWNDLAHDIREWRVELRDRYGIPIERELHACDPVLDTGYDAWEDGERTKDIPIDRVIGGPAFRDSASDHLIQMTDFIAHALLKQEGVPSPRACPVSSTGMERQGIAHAFGTFDHALNRRASRRDSQGVVRR